MPSCTGHDEDADRHPDACDLCPTVADDQANPDGDETSSRCDVTSGPESIPFFDPFIADRLEWGYGPAPHAYVNDALATDLRDTYLFMDRAETATDDHIELAGTIVAVGSDGTSQIALSFYSGGTPHYYCEIYRGGTRTKLALTYTLDNVTFVSIAEVEIPAGFQPGPFTLVADHRDESLRCDAFGASVIGTIPAEFGAVDRLAIQAQGADLRFHHYLHVRTN